MDMVEVMAWLIQCVFNKSMPKCLLRLRSKVALMIGISASMKLITELWETDN